MFPSSITCVKFQIYLLINLFIYFSIYPFCQTNQLLKFRQASLVTDSLSSLEKAVPAPREEDEPDVGMLTRHSEVSLRLRFRNFSLPNGTVISDGQIRSKFPPVPIFSALFSKRMLKQKRNDRMDCAIFVGPDRSVSQNHLQGWCQMFRLNRIETDRFICLANRNFRIFLSTGEHSGLACTSGLVFWGRVRTKTTYWI